MRFNPYLVTFCGFALISPLASPAQTPAPESFLARRTAHVDDDVTGYKSDIDYLVFRDGLLIGWQRQPDRTVLIRARGTPESVATLQRTFSQNRLGAQAGRCFYRDQPGQGGIQQSALTWFGRTGRRQQTLAFGIAFPVLCSSELIRSIDAISSYLPEAGSQPGTQIETVPGDIFDGLTEQAVTEAPAPESYLVRRTTHVDDDLTGFKVDLDYVIFRDGLVVGVQRQPNATFLVRARGTQESVQTLQRTLSQNRFGSQAGRCFYRDQPEQGGVFQSAVTWFGRTGTRQRTVTFGDQFSGLCDPSFTRSIEAISTFISEAGNRPDAQIEQVPPDIFGAFTAPLPCPEFAGRRRLRAAPGAIPAQLFEKRFMVPEIRRPGGAPPATD